MIADEKPVLFVGAGAFKSYYIVTINPAPFLIVGNGTGTKYIENQGKIRVQNIRHSRLVQSDTLNTGPLGKNTGKPLNQDARFVIHLKLPL